MKRPLIASLPWTPEEEAQLRAMAQEGDGPASIAKQLGRTEQATRHRFYKLGIPLKRRSRHMAQFKTAGISYADLRKECLEAVRSWPRCETVAGIQIIRDDTPAGFSVQVTLYGKADVQTADRAMIYVEREKRRQYHLIE